LGRCGLALAGPGAFFLSSFNCTVFQGFDFTYFFREVKLHKVLVHVFIKRGEVKFS
jgi:hypothetical protein